MGNIVLITTKMDFIQEIFFYLFYFFWVVSFVIRLIYFGITRSLENELDKLRTFNYFIPIELSDAANSKWDRRITWIIHYALKGFYLFSGLLFFSLMVEIIMDSLPE